MCSINWTKSRGHILFHKILSKRSPCALKDEEPCLFYCKDTPNSLGGMRLLHYMRKIINGRVDNTTKETKIASWWSENLTMNNDGKSFAGLLKCTHCEKYEWN